MKSLPWRLLTIAIFLQACAQEPSSATNAAADVPKELAGDTAATPPLPEDDLEKQGANEENYGLPLKPKEQRDALMERWKKAYSQELAALKDPKIDAWMNAHPTAGIDDLVPPLPQTDLKALDAKQLLYYALVNPEEFSQNCSEFSGYAGLVQVLSRKLPYDDYGLLRSDRQTDALQAKHDEVDALVVRFLKENKTVSERLMFHIADLELQGAILPLIDIYQAQTLKDDLILTTLLELMERGECFPWIMGDLFKKMLISPNNTVELNENNAETIISFASAFARRQQEKAVQGH
jgi:hypothetical protein